MIKCDIRKQVMNYIEGEETIYAIGDTALTHHPTLKTEPVDVGRNLLKQLDSYHATNNKRTTRVLDKIFNTHTYREPESLLIRVQIKVGCNRKGIKHCQTKYN